MSYERTTISYPEPDFPFRIDSTSSRPEIISSRPLHTHSEAVELQYIHYGNGQYYIGGRFHALRPRTLCIIPANSPHAYLKQGTSLILKKTSLIFSPTLLREQAVEKELARWLRPSRNPSRQHLFLNEGSAARTEQLLTLIGQEWKGKAPFYRESIRRYLYQLLIEIERAWQNGTRAGGPDCQGSLMARLLTFIDASFSKPLKLADVAAHADRSPFHVSHLFKQAQGLTFTQYVAARRVVEARRLLERNDPQKVFAIAMETGFVSLSTFNRTFLRLVGMSPDRYRRLHNPRL